MTPKPNEENQFSPNAGTLSKLLATYPPEAAVYLGTVYRGNAQVREMTVIKMLDSADDKGPKQIVLICFDPNAVIASLKIV